LTDFLPHFFSQDQRGGELGHSEKTAAGAIFVSRPRGNHPEREKERERADGGQVPTLLENIQLFLLKEKLFLQAQLYCTEEYIDQFLCCG
jgi:hypothetical protein